ncbi:uncharacterized protein [Diadema setosum]|uniref:uncharacterized protein n=1 Tax=Diadema setosum TaxID=31175 RepID=UPI003B3A9D58
MTDDGSAPSGVAGMPLGKTSVTRQGHSAGTILTNRSRNLPIITPLKDRKSVTAPSLNRGTRWMHRTTLTMERNPADPDFNTSTKEAYSGSKNLSGAQRPTPYPTLHTSHFDIGTNRRLHHKTHYKMQFPQHDYEHPNKLHYKSIANWTRNVVGTDMQEALSRQGHKPDYWSSYANVHNRLGLRRGEGVPHARTAAPTYNILTGQETGANLDRDHHLISGNRVLNKVRLNPEQSLILQ